MTRPLILSALFTASLAGCSSAGGGDDATDATLDAYVAAVDAMHTLVDDHVTAVEAAADVDAVTQLQADYTTEWEHAMEDFGHAMEDVAACSMDGDSMAMVTEAQDMATAMVDEAAAYTAAHSAHSSVDDCVAAVGSHEEAMDAMVDTLLEHHDHWHDAGMECGMHDDSGAHMD